MKGALSPLGGEGLPGGAGLGRCWALPPTPALLPRGSARCLGLRLV